jgi:hypothetical protein
LGLAGIFQRFWPKSDSRVALPSVLSADRGLFVVGAPRSGTTILQNALNHSPAVFLLGEANLHLESGEGHFAASYNARYQSLSHHKTKSTFCPPVLKVDGTSEDYLNRLGQSYRWVGAKVVINNLHSPDWVERLTKYHCERFYQAHYLFTFRHPLAAIHSTRDLQLITSHEPDPAAKLLDNYLESVQLFLCAVRNLSHVRAVFHEDMSAAKLQGIGAWLGVDLSEAAAYYDNARVRSYETSAFEGDDRVRIERIAELYDVLRREASVGFATPQIEQTDNHLSPTHYTALGRLDKEVREIRRRGSA